MQSAKNHSFTHHFTTGFSWLEWTSAITCEALWSIRFGTKRRREKSRRRAPGKRLKSTKHSKLTGLLRFGIGHQFIARSRNSSPPCTCHWSPQRSLPRSCSARSVSCQRLQVWVDGWRCISINSRSLLIWWHCGNTIVDTCHAKICMFVAPLFTSLCGNDNLFHSHGWDRASTIISSSEAFKNPRGQSVCQSNSIWGCRARGAVWFFL